MKRTVQYWRERAVQYFRERLAEPELLKRAVLLDVKANEVPLAVPVGKSRRGGHIEFLARREAEKALELLKGFEGFPDLRIIGLELRWGTPPPFAGWDYGEPFCALLLGIYYGYKDKAIASQFKHYSRNPRRTWNRKSILKIIAAARKLDG